MRLLKLVVLLVFCSVLSLAQQWGSPVWQDEFNGKPGSVPDATKWTFDIGNLHVNDEVEIYCPAASSPKDQSVPRSDAAWEEIKACDAKDDNVSFDGQNLVLRAVRRDGRWTSGRIKTQGRKTFQYGRMEARMKLPFGTGVWPAFWALGDDITAVHWPHAGEIDIMESVPEVGGLGPRRLRSTVHGPGYSGDYGVRNDMDLANGGRVDDGFHVYGLIWSPNMMQFYIDDPANVFFVVTPRDLPAGREWVYNKPFFLILNLAIGGPKSWAGPADDTTPNPAVVLVDYVRVYEAAPIAAPSFAVSPIDMVSGGRIAKEISVSAPQGSGRMYIECLSTSPGVNCAASPYAIDFTSTERATVTLDVSSQKSPIAGGTIRVRAYTVSGEQGSAEIPVKFH